MNRPSGRMGRSVESVERQIKGSTFGTISHVTDGLTHSGPARFQSLTVDLLLTVIDTLTHHKHGPLASPDTRRMSFLSRSDDSDSSGLSNLGRNSRGRRSSTADINSNRLEDIPGSPPLKKLRRSDYNAFASLVNNLKQERPLKPLNERLLARSVTPSRSRPATATADRDDTPLVELSPAFRDGHDVLFDAQTRVDHSLDDRWPLYGRQLGQGADFAETVGIVASKMVRLRRLVNPYLQNRTRVVDDTLDEGDDVIVPLPEDLVESTRMYLDKLLAGLAILRPPLTRPQRERLAPTGWKAVLETAGLVKHGFR